MTTMLAMCVPYPQRLDTAGYQMIIKDDDPESPVRTKTSLLTREEHPSGSRVVNLGGPRCRPPILSCAKLDATTAFLTIYLQLAMCSMSTAQSGGLAQQRHTIWTARNPLFLIVTTSQRSQPRDQCQHQRFEGPSLLVPEFTPSMTQKSRCKLQVPRNLKSRLWSYPPLPGRCKNVDVDYALRCMYFTRRQARLRFLKHTLYNVTACCEAPASPRLGLTEMPDPTSRM